MAVDHNQNLTTLRPITELNEPITDLKPIANQKLDSQAKTFKCATCAVDCTASRYHCLKHITVDICPICYTDGRFSTTLHSGDFVRMREADVQKWTDQETLLLLEGVELYHEDWTRISLHVGKPRDECLLTFLQLPIEDTFVPKEDLSLNNPNNIKTCNATENPILALTAFLASVVTPNVAKKAGIYFY